MAAETDDPAAFVRERPADWAKRIERSAHELLAATIDAVMAASPEALLGDYHAALTAHLTAGLATLRAWLQLEPGAPEAAIRALTPSRPRWAEALAEARAEPSRLAVPAAAEQLVALLHGVHADLQDGALEDRQRRALARARWSARCAEVQAEADAHVAALHAVMRARLQQVGALADYRRSLAEQFKKYFADPWVTEYLRADTEQAVARRLERAELR